jgi:SAM-dependent methyltransferase
LGCGNGAVSALLARRGYTVTGVDTSPCAVEWARDEFRRRNLRGEFFVCDVTSGLPNFADASFDLIVDGNCLHCICAVDARAQALRGVHRLLRPNGHFVVSSMCGEPRSLDGADVFDGERRLIMRDGVAYRFLATVDGLTNEVTNLGFDVDNVRVQSNSWWDHLWLVAKRRG